MPKRYTVTSALPYANGPLHIGHIAGAYLPADIFVRYLRLRGEDVVYVCGSDEYGAAITIKAKKEGTTPRAIIDKYHEIMKSAFERFGIAFDIYHRTSEPIHTETSQAIFLKLHEKGEFEVLESEQYFDQVANQFLADRYIMGTCPKCGNENAYGDQCEKCGSSLSPTDLINPHSTLSGSKPVLKKTKHWYLPMNKYEDWLKEWIVKEKQNLWKTNVYGQCKSWIEGGLQARAMTRDLDWGVPVPLKEADGKVLYVWLDAPIGYISATREWAKQHGKNWEDYWKSPDTELYHFVGKDNIVFHCIIFPIILKAHGEFILPTNVPANEFLNLEGDKLSTSRNWAVWLHEYLDEFPDKQDVLRYVLGSILPETKDSEFTWKDYQARNNNELVAIFGNFVNRPNNLIFKYNNGVVPPLGELSDYDKSVLEELVSYPDKIGDLIKNFRFRDALAEMMNVARLGNKYLADTEPWKIKDNPERIGTIMNISLQIIGNLSILCKPFLPRTAEKLEKMLGLDGKANWEEAKKTNLVKVGTTVNKIELLFEKVEDEVIEKQIAKLHQPANNQQQTMNNRQEITTSNNPEQHQVISKQIIPQKELINYDDFSKLDIRIATIVAAEKVAKADKLLKLTLDTGIDTRIVVSGIAEHFKPEEIIGKQITLLANLAPRVIRGIESKGMILTALDGNGKLRFLHPSEAVMNGSTVS
ncbi:methionine--tRNA ligase [Thermoflexibacter ruber]|uniref:Methionine--tRNA ligase n=1 Tax=Thermoflexibacter ruber TaxID=1003 RepID=A0A1I2HID0_9BACT|nr:methionine--tRNA ligase [Thermoflexibacter ruber]SFF28221.1 methionyl-tRNA synthetase [Thermoflexibacter ruber]